MRITAEAKQATRTRILETARRLFRDKGFDGTGIRDIAAEVGMATGTLFNYFASKEEVAVALAEAAAEDAEREFAARRRDGASLREDLFLLTAAQLRSWRPLRKFIQPILDAAFAAPVFSDGGRAGSGLPAGHLQAAADIAAAHGIAPERWSTTAPIYWALYVGVLAFWGRDDSPKQEDTLAMLDQSTKMFAAWLEAPR